MKKMLLSIALIFIVGNLTAQDLKMERNRFSPFHYKFYEGDQKISRDDFKTIIKSNPTAYEQYTSGRKLYTVGNIIGLPSASVLGFSLGMWTIREDRKEKPNIALFTISGLGALGGMVIMYIGEAKIKKGVKIYNGSEKLGLNLNVNENGAGIAFHF